MELFNQVNLRQFETLKYIIDNVQDDHIMCKIKCELRKDKIDAPFYLDTKISISHCTGMYNKGILHAMDVFNHHRMYNIREDKYNEIKDLIDSSFTEDYPHVSIDIGDDVNIIMIEVLEVSDLKDIFDKYDDFFKKIDELA